MIMVVVPQAGDLNSKFTQWIVDASLYYMFVYLCTTQIGDYCGHSSIRISKSKLIQMRCALQYIMVYHVLSKGL